MCGGGGGGGSGGRRTKTNKQESRKKGNTCSGIGTLSHLKERERGRERQRQTERVSNTDNKKANNIMTVVRKGKTSSVLWLQLRLRNVVLKIFLKSVRKNDDNKKGKQHYNSC